MTVEELSYKDYVYKTLNETILGFINVRISSEQRSKFLYKHICTVSIFEVELFYTLWRTGHYDKIENEPESLENNDDEDMYDFHVNKSIKDLNR